MAKALRDLDTKHKLLVVFAIALIVPWFAMYNINQGYWWDEAVYLGLARNVLEGQGYWINVPGQEAFRPPLFAYLTAGIWSITGISEPIVKFLPPLFGVLSALLIFYWARRMYSTEIGIWSFFLTVTAHYFLFYGQKFLTETIFVFLSLMGLYLLYTGLEDNKKWYLPLSGIMIALAFLTRYPGLILIAVFVIYPFIRNVGSDYRKWEKHLIKSAVSTAKNWGFWLGIILFVLIITPWMLHGIAVFGSPTGAMSVGLGTVTEGFYLGEWYFYFVHWIEIFGLIGIFGLFGLVYLVLERSNSNNLLLLLAVLTMAFFIYIPRKETRYLLHFFEVYMVVVALGIWKFRKWLRSDMVIPIIAIVLIMTNVFAGIQMVYNDYQGGRALRDAGYWIGERVPEGMAVMSNNIPPIFYTAGSHIVYFPESREDLWEVVNNESVSYLLIEAREPTYPEWLWVIDKDDKLPSGVLEEEGFTLERTFSEVDWNGNDKALVWVYSV